MFSSQADYKQVILYAQLKKLVAHDFRTSTVVNLETPVLLHRARYDYTARDTTTPRAVRIHRARYDYTARGTTTPRAVIFGLQFNPLKTQLIGASLSESHMDRKASPANYVSTVDFSSVRTSRIAYSVWCLTRCVTRVAIHPFFTCMDCCGAWLSVTRPAHGTHSSRQHKPLFERN